ncbi:hypothetical protein IHN32_00335 [Deinococcus sp. 14RED07]|uniref:hypothetical protein n=1 Tax=unclassified Deinococcus TaxID=2623546 RepID=UPI001E5B9412|nr:MULTISPECIES: hypothetical protein [unclassified Deinococcus]MCD0164871.1 hypothetical protein [Deinococcus sp. 12RED42]MCD0174404.1 hypothetical protein [Deinococcus sp. 14RED07]
MRLIVPLSVLLLAPAGAQPASTCRLTMTPATILGASYKVTLRVDPSCPADRTFHVRKSSTLNTRAAGAPYQPIRPDGSAAFRYAWSWPVSATRTAVPAAELFTLFTWEWQVYDDTLWNPATRRYGRWIRIAQAGRP